MTDDWVTPPFLDAVRQFERAHPDVRVVIDKGPIRLMPEAVRAGMGSGAPPDVVQGHAFAAAAQELAQPLDDLWDSKLKVGEFFPGAIEDVTWNGKRYGVPLDTNAMVLMYNVDDFRAAGVPEPGPSMTFAEFEAAARALTSADGSRRGIAIPTSGWWTYGWVRANGGETVQVGQDGQARLTLDAQPVTDALGYLARLVRDGVAFGPRGADSHSADAFALFRSGRAAMYTNGSWDLATLRKTPAGASYRTALMPRGPGGEAGTSMGGSSMFVPKGSKHRELAFDFMTQLISDPYALRLAREEGRLPVRLRVFDDPFFSDPDFRVFLEQLKTAHPPKIDAFPDASKSFATAVAEVLREGGRDPASALADAQRQAVATLAVTVPTGAS
ncbi:MAG: extracellular solute-binding protein [Acidimicrobiales bacterium]